LSNVQLGVENFLKRYDDKNTVDSKDILNQPIPSLVINKLLEIHHDKKIIS